MPFRHPDRAHDLATRLEVEVRERLEEAVDFVCLQALVASRRERGLPPPVADRADDRREFEAHVRAFLALLGAALAAEPAPPAPGEADLRAPLDVQVRLARQMPDYWQRFEALSARYLAAPGAPQELEGRAEPPMPSGGEGRALLSRLFGRG